MLVDDEGLDDFSFLLISWSFGELSSLCLKVDRRSHKDSELSKDYDK